MEDSYMVHRRRKAAARKREKTPDPSSRGAASRMDASEDEDDDRRARMERMVEEAEKLERQQKENRLSQQWNQDTPLKEPENKDKKGENQEQRPARKKDRTEARNSANVDDMIAVRAEVAAKSVARNSSKTRETDAIVAGDNNTRQQPIKQVIEVAKRVDDATAKSDVIKPGIIQTIKDDVQETLETLKEASGETSRPAEARKVERRIKRKSKERVERHSRSTDSSDADEKNESSRRRTKSPEVRPRVKKTSGKSRISDPEAQKKDVEKLNRERRSSSRQKLEDEPQMRDNSAPHRRSYNQTEEKAEETDLKTSESFPQRSIEERIVKRSSIEMRKQIIPLSNESLIEDFARAQREYLLRERSILDSEAADDVFQDAVEVSSLRRRKFSLPYNESEQEDIIPEVTQSSEAADKKTWFSWLSFWRGKKKDEDVLEKKIEDEPEPVSKVEEVKVKKQEVAEKITVLNFFRALRDVVNEFKTFVAQNPRETLIIRRLRNRCIAGLLLVMIYCGLGGFVFRFVEGAFETFYKCGVKRVKRDFLDTLWNYSHNLREDDWKSMARRKLMEFEEQLHTAHEAGLHSYSGQKNWSFLNAVVYCLTVITTIGENYGGLWEVVLEKVQNGKNFPLVAEES